jgi:hypothetical protein
MKRQEKKKPVNWTKVFIVMFCVLFAFAMIATYMSPVVGSMRTIKLNESVTADVTVRDARGNPLITTDQQVYASSPLQSFLLRQPMILTAGARSSDLITVDAYNHYTGWVRFSFLWLEVDEMNAGVVGMRTGETRNVKFNFTQPLEMNVSAEEYEAMGGNFTTAEPGDWFPIGFAATPPLQETGTAPKDSVRLATILHKTNESMVISYRYASADITVRDFQNQ